MLFDEVRPNPTDKNVMDGAAKVKAEGCDFVIALGGGSVMDCSKCIALMATNDGDIWDSNAKTGKDFIAALDKLIADVGCADLKMSEAGITRDELKLYPQKVHEVLGGDITADPVALTDADYLAIYEAAYK